MMPRLGEWKAVRDRWDPDAPLPLRAVGAALRGSRVKAVVVGATRGMGRALARALAERGDALWLLGREPSELLTPPRATSKRGAPRARSGQAVLDLAQPAGFAARARRRRRARSTASIRWW